MKNFKNLNNQKIYQSFYDLLKKDYKFDDDKIDKIWDQIEYYTNKYYNFEYYKSWYDDVIDDWIIDDFLDDRILKYDTLDEVKCEFSDFIYEKYSFDYDTQYYYEDELVKEFKRIDENVDWWDLLHDIQDQIWILWFDVDVFSLCKSEYKIAIFTKEDHDIFSSCFYDCDIEYLKNDLKKHKKNPYILQKLCKNHGFDIKTLYYYLKDDKSNKNYWIGEKLYNENEFFKSLYKELSECMWYNEDLCFLLKLSIDEILSFCVKDSDFELWRSWSCGFYAGWNWSGSLFEINIQNPLKVKTSDLCIRMYDKTRIESVYWFCDCVFN